MLSKTSETAVKALIYLATHDGRKPISPRHIAEKLGLSATYMAKVTRLLVKANILRAQKGALGGVMLDRPPEGVTLLAIVEACQGHLVGDFCSEIQNVSGACAYHQAAAQIHDALIGVLSRWTLADLAAKPGPSVDAGSEHRCRISSGVSESVFVQIQTEYERQT